MYWLEFFISALFIVLAGVRLTHYVDQLSDVMNWGKTWVGVILLGCITSLPEIITSLSAVISLHAPDLAIGNILGSNCINPMLIVLMDIVYREGSITDAIPLKRSHLLAGSFVLFLTLIILGDLLGMFPMVGSFGMGSILVGLFFVVGMRLIATAEVQSEAVFLPVSTSKTVIWGNVIVCALVVVFAAMRLAHSSDVIAQQTGLGQTFVGSILLAFVTSLPEIVVTLSALKMRAFDLAIGNILGSNMTNIFIVFLCDLFWKTGSVLQGVSTSHVLTGILSFCLVSVILVGLKVKPKKCILRLGWDSWIMVLLYGVGTIYIYRDLF